MNSATKFISQLGIVTGLAFWAVAGCESMPGAGGLINPDPANNNGVRAPSVRFQNPTDSIIVRDDSTLKIRYSVESDRAMTARLSLDPDGTAGNGNEVEIGAAVDVDGSGSVNEVELVAGRYPYGTYFVRLQVTDATSDYSFLANGPVSVVPLIDDATTTDSEALTTLGDLSGKRLLYTNGSPGPVNSRVPFLATWYLPDYADQLSPVFIQPFELNQKMEISRLQFYTFGRTDAEAKRVVIYQGTDENGIGTVVRQIDTETISYETGGWNMIEVDPPLVLEPGKYGVTYHGKFEFHENWAGNAAKGAGYVWLSPFENLPFEKADEKELGFGPNMTMRVIGNLVPESNVPLANSRIVIPKPLDPVYPDNGAKPPEGLGTKNEEIDELGGSSPFHITWQHAR